MKNRVAYKKWPIKSSPSEKVAQLGNLLSWENSYWLQTDEVGFNN